MYIDDILVYSDTFAEHVSMIETVLRRCNDSGILLKQDKCDFLGGPRRVIMSTQVHCRLDTGTGHDKCRSRMKSLRC